MATNSYRIEYVQTLKLHRNYRNHFSLYMSQPSSAPSNKTFVGAIESWPNFFHVIYLLFLIIPLGFYQLISAVNMPEALHVSVWS